MSNVDVIFIIRNKTKIIQRQQHLPNQTLRKKLTFILLMEESLPHGKILNREQEEVLRSKPHVAAAIDELEKLQVDDADQDAREGVLLDIRLSDCDESKPF
ncbi:hypothetical protein Vadar_002248 [Vaccinium darrowii]|uniref:Uncharacterized protein n=1 Tax=Vaccinium darrowii TaxID=229202 RepID=A0ACB7YJV2_9ERIC|nr:hypothetical protein Vadar_002248 [Vaccinium darrowii]